MAPKRQRSYNYTFTVHNQGTYAAHKKEEFLTFVQTRYPLSGYLIVQELYPNCTKTALHEDKLGDSHLQGTLYFTSQVDFYPLLNYLKELYKEVKVATGILNRVELLPIAKGTTTQMDNYFKGTSKIGGDPNPLTNMEGRIQDQINFKFNAEFQRVFMMSILRSKGQEVHDTILEELTARKIKLI